MKTIKLRGNHCVCFAECRLEDIKVRADTTFQHQNLSNNPPSLSLSLHHIANKKEYLETPAILLFSFSLDLFEGNSEKRYKWWRCSHCLPRETITIQILDWLLDKCLIRKKVTLSYSEVCLVELRESHLSLFTSVLKLWN